jgi:hypothetical protein
MALFCHPPCCYTSASEKKKNKIIVGNEEKLLDFYFKCEKRKTFPFSIHNLPFIAIFKQIIMKGKEE